MIENETALNNDQDPGVPPDSQIDQTDDENIRDESPDVSISEDESADSSESSDQTPEETAPADAEQDSPPVEVTLISVIEAVLFAADEPVTPQKLAEITGAAGVKEVREQIEQLNKKYEQMACAFRIDAIAGGYQMLTLPEYNTWLRKLIKVRSETKLSPAALETLAIIAYKQPILRVDIESIRGVAAGEMVRQLIEKGLVKIAGRAEVPGRPLLYGTTKKFLQTFGLDSLKDLPSNEDLKKPD